MLSGRHTSMSRPGWPAPSNRIAERPHPLGAWVTAPLPGDEAAAATEAPPDVPGFTTEGGGREGPEGAVDERLLAKDDPLVGLLHMQVQASCVQAACKRIQNFGRCKALLHLKTGVR